MGSTLVPLICPGCGGNINPTTLICDSCNTKFMLTSDNSKTEEKELTLYERIRAIKDAEDDEIFMKLSRLKPEWLKEHWLYEYKFLNALFNHPKYAKDLQDMYGFVYPYLERISNGTITKWETLEDSAAIADALNAIEGFGTLGVGINEYGRYYTGYKYSAKTKEN